MEVTEHDSVESQDPHEWSLVKVDTFVRSLGPPDDDTVVVSDDETYETHYGFRDPMIDVLCRSYLYVWTMKGGHARFVTYTEHTGKCKTTTIPKWSSTTFYRWKQREEQNYVKSPDKDEKLPQEARPIRHERQVHGFWRTVQQDRTFGNCTTRSRNFFSII